MNLLERLRDAAERTDGELSVLLNEAADAILNYSEERIMDKARIEQASNRVTVLKEYVDELERKLGKRAGR